MGSKIERAFENRTKFSIKKGLKRILFRQLKRTINQYKNVTRGEKKQHFFCKKVLLYTINNISLLMEIIIIKFSCILKMMSRNIFPEHQPDSASYINSKDNQLAGFRDPQVGLFHQRISNISNYNPVTRVHLNNLSQFLITFSEKFIKKLGLTENKTCVLFFNVHSFCIFIYFD